MGKTIIGMTKLVIQNGKFYYIDYKNIFKVIPLNLTKNKSTKQIVSYFNNKYGFIYSKIK